MKENETFKMTYSARQQEEIDKIREKYIPKEQDKMEQIRALDAGVGKKAVMGSAFVGILGVLFFGTGMSLSLSDFGSLLGEYGFFCGILIGVFGIAILACVYPVYRRILKKEREKIAPQILRLTDELLNGQTDVSLTGGGRR